MKMVKWRLGTKYRTAHLFSYLYYKIIYINYQLYVQRDGFIVCSHLYICLFSSFFGQVVIALSKAKLYFPQTD